MIRASLLLLLASSSAALAAAVDEACRQLAVALTCNVAPASLAAGADPQLVGAAAGRDAASGPWSEMANASCCCSSWPLLSFGKCACSWPTSTGASSELSIRLSPEVSHSKGWPPRKAKLEPRRVPVCRTARAAKSAGPSATLAEGGWALAVENPNAARLPLPSR